MGFKKEVKTEPTWPPVSVGQRVRHKGSRHGNYDGWAGTVSEIKDAVERDGKVIRPWGRHPILVAFDPPWDRSLWCNEDELEVVADG